jgi:hypothetical protein
VEAIAVSEVAADVAEASVAAEEAVTLAEMLAARQAVVRVVRHSVSQKVRRSASCRPTIG